MSYAFAEDALAARTDLAHVNRFEAHLKRGRSGQKRVIVIRGVPGHRVGVDGMAVLAERLAPNVERHVFGTELDFLEFERGVVIDVVVAEDGLRVLSRRADRVPAPGEIELPVVVPVADVKPSLLPIDDVVVECERHVFFLDATLDLSVAALGEDIILFRIVMSRP